MIKKFKEKTYRPPPKTNSRLKLYPSLCRRNAIVFTVDRGSDRSRRYSSSVRPSAEHSAVVSLVRYSDTVNTVLIE